MKPRLTWGALMLAGWCGCQPASPPPAPTAAAPTIAAAAIPVASADEGALYALGAMLGKNIEDLQLTPPEVEAVKSGLADRALGKTLKFDPAVFGPQAEQLQQARRNAAIQAIASAQKIKDQPFLDAAAKEPGAQTLEGGLIKRLLAEGQGPSPKPGDQVRISYTGSLANGTVFDGTDKRGGDARRPLNSLIPCLSRALLTMKEGESARLVCPSALGYGDRGRVPGIPGGATLVFEAQLLEINPPQAPAPPPHHARQPVPEPGE